MFTGIIEEVGKVRSFQNRHKTGVLEILSTKICQDVNIGDSIAVNGTCLTLTKINKNILIFDLLGETLSKTNLENLKVNEPINLERSLKVGERLSGHFVYGHIDGIRPIIGFNKKPGEYNIDLEIEKGDFKFLVEKGSIAVDGISLTIGKVLNDRIRIYLIPHTLENTALFNKKTGYFVNVEFDVLGKLLLNQQKKKGITEDFLKKTGF